MGTFKMTVSPRASSTAAATAGRGPPARPAAPRVGVAGDVARLAIGGEAIVTHCHAHPMHRTTTEIHRCRGTRARVTIDQFRHMAMQTYTGVVRRWLCRRGRARPGDRVAGGAAVVGASGVVGRGHVSLLTNSDTWHSKIVRDIGYL
jgi:hypothetical protein